MLQIQLPIVLSGATSCGWLKRHLLLYVPSRQSENHLPWKLACTMRILPFLLPTRGRLTASPSSSFLAPGTGIACDLQNLCVDKSSLEIVKASELLVSNNRSTGKGGSRSLQKVIDQFGGSSRGITSGSNFSNFATTVRSAAYAVSFIDGVPVEETTAKKVWLVFFPSQVPTNPRAIDFSPATVSVYEVEFVD